MTFVLTTAGGHLIMRHASLPLIVANAVRVLDAGNPAFIRDTTDHQSIEIRITDGQAELVPEGERPPDWSNGITRIVNRHLKEPTR